MRLRSPLRRRTVLDIVVTFNDVDYEHKREYAPRRLGSRGIGFVDQLCVLGASARVHVPEARRFAVHTQGISRAQHRTLTAHGWTVVSRTRNPGPPELERFHDRLAGYTVGRAPAQLYLDSDMIFTGRPQLDLRAPVAVAFAGNPAFDAATWGRLCELADTRPLPAGALEGYSYDDWFCRGVPSEMPFFNNGAVLVRRDIRSGFASRMIEIGERLLDSGLLGTVPRLGHFFDQVCMSLAVRGTPGSALLPPGVNTLRSMVDLTDPRVRSRATLIHYLGSTDVGDVYQHYPEHFDAGLTGATAGRAASTAR